jgi:hypothetical protein
MRFCSSLAVLAVLLAGCAPVSAVPPEPSGAELDALMALELDFQWRYVGLAPDDPRPAVERIRVISPTEAQTVYRQCMVDAGYEKFNVITASIYGGASTEQRVAIYTCTAQYPTPPSSYGLFSQAQLSFLYDYYVEVTVPCIESSGVAVTRMPTREQFVQPPGYPFETWVPYRELEGDLGYLATTKCPYVPEGFTQF